MFAVRQMHVKKVAGWIYSVFSNYVGISEGGCLSLSGVLVVLALHLQLGLEGLERFKSIFFFE